jgi:PAS domain S-box-containing protein
MNISKAAELLRQRAEAKIAAAPKNIEALSPESMRKALHELHVHQIELEMQNEELCRAQSETDAARARYFDLYDLAPVGYITLSFQGLILEANLTAATQLGASRAALIHRSFQHYIHSESADVYYLFFRHRMKTREPQACELRLVKSDGSPFWAHLAASVGEDHHGAPLHRMTMIDITERKRVDLALRESEAKLQSALSSMTDAVFISNTEGRFVEFNDAFATFHKFRTKAECAKPLADYPAFLEVFLPNGDLVPLEQWGVPRALRGETVTNAEYTLRRKDTGETWVGSFSFAPIRDRADLITGSVVVGRDITEHKRVEELVRESEENYRTLANSGMALIWTSGTDKKCNYFNQAWLRFTGRTLEQELGDGWTDSVHPDDLAYCFKIYTEAFDQRKTFSMDYRMRRHDGEFRWIQDEGTPRHDSRGTFLGYIGHCLDITERKRMEVALLESDERFAQLAEQSGTFIWEVDAQGLYTYASPVVEKVLGYRPDELINRMHFYDLHPKSDRDSFKTNALGAFQRKEAFTNFVNAAQAQDGRAVWLVTTGQPLLNADGSLRGYRGSDTDITARTQKEAEQQKIDQLQSIGTLAGGIAHDFNNILLGIFGNISIAMDVLSQAHPSYAPLAEAEKSMNRAVRLTTQLLTFAKGGAPVKEHIGLGEMVEEVARFDLTGSNVSLAYHHAEDLWPVDADKGQLQQVISNLVINARQAMPAGGILTITMENAELLPEAFPGLSAGRYVKATVQDAGSGIEPNVISHIFDPYFTTKQTGNGLGLATAWSIINKHNGHIGVVSLIGKGTTFTFYLPASTSPQPMESKPPAAECPAPVRPAKILVMDDEEMVCDLVVKMLTRFGYSASTSHSGQEAIALYRQALEAGASFDLVIMDLTIPGGIGGKEAVKDLLAIDPNVRAIVSSGYADDPVMANPTKYGFKGTVAKPYTARALRETVARALA